VGLKLRNAKQGRVEAVEERLAIERNLSEREADLAASQDNLREANHALSLLRYKTPNPRP